MFRCGTPSWRINMQSQTLKTYLRYLLLLTSFALLATSANAQRKLPSDELPIVKGDCPKPISFTLAANNPATFDPTHFSQAQVGALHMTTLGDASVNKNFLYTFKWKRTGECCQITKAILTVNMKANQAGSTTGSDAGNDGIAIMYQGNVVAPYNEAVYSNVTKPFNGGQPATKSWTLTGAALANLNQSGTLSFSVQDDTQVVSATLQVWGCCLGTTN